MKQLAVILLFMACFVESRASGALADDSLYCFRFVRGKGMFYVLYKGNGQALERLMVLIGMHREDILSGNIPVFVEGFCPDRKTARERSNRVKSEMILRGGLHEACFRTVNHVQEGDYVEVRLRLPAAPQASEQADDADAVSETENMPHDIDTTHCAADTAVVPAASLSASPLGSQPDKDGRHDFGSAFALRTNLLRLATLTADFGLEYRMADARIAILLNGTYADWGWKEKQRRYKIWRVSPEARCYLGTRRRGFLGAMYHRGGFHYKLDATGKAGDYQGGGITGGYRLPLTRHWAFDFHAAAGYTRAEYDEYTRIGTVNVLRNKSGKLVKDYWGINQLGVSLLYDF